MGSRELGRTVGNARLKIRQQPFPFYGSAQGTEQQRSVVPPLHDVVLSSGTNSVHRQPLVIHARHDHHRNPRRRRLHTCECIEADAIGQVEIQDNCVEMPRSQTGRCG